MPTKATPHPTYTDILLERCVLLRQHSQTVHQEAKYAIELLHQQIYSLDVTRAQQSSPFPLGRPHLVVQHGDPETIQPLDA